MRILFKISSFIDSAVEKSGRYISWLTTILVLLVCYDVAARYLFKYSIVAVQELEWHIFAALFLLGASYTLKKDQHVRVDLFYSKFSEKQKAIVNLAGTVLFLIPFCLIIIIFSKNFVVNSFLMGESSPDPGGLPARYIIKAVLPLSFFILLFQGISLLLKSVITLFNNNPDSN